MLVFNRRNGEQIVCDEIGLTLTVLEAKNGRVRLGISAPREVVFDRAEVAERRLCELSEQITQRVQRVA